MGDWVTDLGVVVVPEQRRDGMSYLLIPLVKRRSPELAPLRETLRAWVTVVATSADPCIVLNRDGRIAGVSASAGALFAEAPVELVGRRLVGDGLTLTLDAIATALHADDGTVIGSLTFFGQLAAH